MWFTFDSGRSAITRPHPADAFRQRSFEYLDGLYNFALHQSPDPSAAEDLVIETYLEARSRLEQIPEADDFKRWLFKVMRDTAIRRRRNGWSKRVPSATNDGIDSHLAELPETHRLAMILFAVEKFTFREIADILGSRPGTVVDWLDTARRRLELDQRHRA